MRFAEPMEDLIQVRVARAEKRQLMETARRLGVSLSDLVRERAALTNRPAQGGYIG